MFGFSSTMTDVVHIISCAYLLIDQIYRERRLDFADVLGIFTSLLISRDVVFPALEYYFDCGPKIEVESTEFQVVVWPALEEYYFDGYSWLEMELRNASSYVTQHNY